MAFLNKSIEDSLKLLNEEAPVLKKRGRPKRNMSPSRAPKMSPTSTFIGSRRSPTREMVKAEIKQSPTIVVNSITNDEVISDVEDNTNGDDILDTLTKNFFTIIRILTCENEPIYIVTYDPNGQIVYIELTDVYTINNRGYPLVKVDKEDYIDFSYSVKEYLKNRITNEIYGIVLVDNGNYGFMKKDDSGDVIENYYGSGDVSDSLSYYCIYRYDDIKRDFSISVSAISKTYFVIQQYQLILNKEIFKELSEELSKLSSYFEDFDSAYKRHAESILTDWQHFSNISNEYSNKFSEDGELNEDLSEKYKIVSSNLFVRFQAFNEICSHIYTLKEYSTSVQPIKNKLKEIIQSFDQENSKICSKILSKDEIDISL